MTLEIVRKLRPGAEAVSEAKRALKELEGYVPDAVLETVRILVTELVTNSVRHAKLNPQDDIGLGAKVSSEILRAEVCDPGLGFQVPSEKQQPELAENSGWGLCLLEELAERWGVERRGKNKCVWFELQAGPLKERIEGRSTGAVGNVLHRAFSAEVREERGVPVMGVSGDVDLSTLPELQSAIEEALDRAESLCVRSIVLDFDKVDFFDSTGIGLLVGSTKKLREEGGEVHLVLKEGPCLLGLVTTGLDKVFRIHSDLESAIGEASRKS